MYIYQYITYVCVAVVKDFAITNKKIIKKKTTTTQ